LKFRLLSTSQVRGAAEDGSLHTMPSASPLYNQFPAVLADPDCPYRYPSGANSACPVSADSLPPGASHKLPADYDPFKFLSAMAEQSLTGNFSPHAHASQACAAATSGNFLFNHHHNASQMQGGFASPGSMTSSSQQFYTSQSTACCMYTPGGGVQRMGDFPTTNGNGEGFGPQTNGTGTGGDNMTCKKNFLCSADDFVENGESDNLLSWTRQHPEHWNRTEVLDWLFFVGQERGIDMQDFRAEAFQSLTRLPTVPHDPRTTSLVWSPSMELSSTNAEENSSAEPGNNQQVVPTPDCTDLSPYSAVSCDSSRASPDTFQGYQMPRKACATAMEQCPPEYEVFTPSYPSSAPMRTSCYYPGCPYPPQLPRRRPGRPRVKSLPEDDERSAKDKKAKNQHLWEFIYETLLNPLYNPQYLRWENQREGVFRFVQSEAVAQLWGSRKNNENMTYEKLSRAMRHYYKRGILERVEGRRLVYKFSRKAMDRVREKRHNSV
ncbi:hypothetical protein BaRGS_00032785, partial [Batillaria attramentaria]